MPNKFEIKDRIIRGITEDKSLKIAAVKTTDVVKEAKQRHNLSLTATVILGKALTGVMLLAADLKGEERVILHIEGDGKLGKITAEANHLGEIRGFVQYPQAEIDIERGETLKDAVGNGTLSVTKIIFEQARPITGTISLVHKNVSGDLADYLLFSEQITSAIILDVGITPQGEVEEAGGIIVQTLPGASEQVIQQVAKNLDNLRKISEFLHREAYIDELIKRAIHPLKFKELARYPVHFTCRCSKQRFADALQMLPLDDLKSLQGQRQELICHYCAEKYYFTPDELAQILERRLQIEKEKNERKHTN